MYKFILTLALCPFLLHGQTTETSSDLLIYLDCNTCDNAYLRQNISQVEFVRDRKVADVHLLFTNQRNGSGGSSEMIQFIGIGEFIGEIDTLSYSLDVNMTSDERRKKQKRYIELGLIHYLIKKGNYDDITVELGKKEQLSDTIKDPWNYWVFGLNLNGWANGQETRFSVNMNSSISAKRVTKENKFSLWANYNRNYQQYKYEDETVIGNQENTNVSIQEVISINNKWSYGIFADGGNSIFRNYDLYGQLGTGIEYNFFPYDESATKQVIASYSAGVRYNDYIDTTIFNKDREFLAQHRLLLAGSVKQQWGSASGSVSWNNFLHDFKLNSTSFWLNFNIRLFKGFSWRINGSFDVLHDQINLKKQDASLEDILLQQQQLGSGYSFWMSTGINYSFGSIYNSIVNPRFDF